MQSYPRHPDNVLAGISVSLCDKIPDKKTSGMTGLSIGNDGQAVEMTVCFIPEYSNRINKPVLFASLSDFR